MYKSLFGERIGLQLNDFMSQMCKLILKLRVEIEIDFLKLLSVNKTLALIICHETKRDIFLLVF